MQRHPDIKGEIDLEALTEVEYDDYLVLVEFKTTNNRKNRKKAYKQLNRHELLFAKSAYRVFKIYAYFDHTAKYGVRTRWIK